MFRGVSLQADFSVVKPELPRPAWGDPVLRLLPEERLRELFTYSGIW